MVGKGAKPIYFILATPDEGLGALARRPWCAPFGCLAYTLIQLRLDRTLGDILSENKHLSDYLCKGVLSLHQVSLQYLSHLLYI